MTFLLFLGTAVFGFAVGVIYYKMTNRPLCDANALQQLFDHLRVPIEWNGERATVTANITIDRHALYFVFNVDGRLVSFDIERLWPLGERHGTS